MSRNANVDTNIHELLVSRHSPYAFDPGRPVASEDLRALFEAARWAMSSYNEQPWRYIVGVKGQGETWEKLHAVLVEGNQPWAANAPVLALGIYDGLFSRNDKPNKAAAHDLGAASAMLTVEATARGLVVHQMIGIEPDKAREAFALEARLEPFTALAIGYAGAPHHIPESYAERDRAPRQRRSVSEFILEGDL
jgi:nitroreductase